MRGPWLLLAVGACTSSPAAFPPLPVVAGATSVVWVANDASGRAVRILRAPGEPLGTTIALEDGSDLELHYFGCGEAALGLAEGTVPSCLPATGQRFRWRPGEPAFTALGDRPSLVPDCASERCEQVVPVEVDSRISAAKGPRDQTSVAALLRGSDPPAVMLSTIDADGQSRLLLFEQGEEPVILAEEPPIGHSSGLWARDGRVFSVGYGGFRRGILSGTSIAWSPSLTSSTATTGIGSARVRVEVLSEDPFELLVVSNNGLVARWSEARIEIVQAGRPFVDGEVYGARSDLAPRVEQGVADGWILVGAAPPARDEIGDWENRTVSLYRDGGLVGEVPLPQVSSVVAHPELGTLLLTESGELYTPSVVEPRLLLSVDTGSAKRVRVFRDRLVILGASSNTGFRDNNDAAIFVRPPSAVACVSNGVVQESTVDLLTQGDWVIEVGEIRQVRWLKAPPECALK